MKIQHLIKRLMSVFATILICSNTYANVEIISKARSLQREGSFDDAIRIYVTYLSDPKHEEGLNDKEVAMYTDVLVQLMNTFQSKGDPDGCIATLKDLYHTSGILQKQCLRDFNSVLGYALSRTENMKEAEETMMKALTIPLHRPTPERYFRDYAYAAAVFYSNPNYYNEVVNWCKEALIQAQLCGNTSGTQWVTSMLGTLYKRHGKLNEALELLKQSKDEAQARNDDLGVLNSLHALTDLFLFWNIPEFANLYASEAVHVERRMHVKNPMISAQTYINKGRVLHGLGMIDSISFYTEHARILCQTLPYNSGMVDVDLLDGICKAEIVGESVYSGIEELKKVTRLGTHVNRAKAYHQLAQTYLKLEQYNMAESMLDSLYNLLEPNVSPTVISIDYKPIIDHYHRTRNHAKLGHYLQLMFKEDEATVEKTLSSNLVESIVALQTGNSIQELKILHLSEKNHRLWLLNIIVIFSIITFISVVIIIRQRKHYKIRIRHADEKADQLVQKLKQSNVEKEMIAQEINDFLKNKDNRQELETLTPYILKEDGETKFRQCFELLYPLFLPRLRERVPAITRREELLSMLIVLKQDNKIISELLAIAPRSVLMLRHRFRQKIGMDTDHSLENFIEEILSNQSIETNNPQP